MVINTLNKSSRINFFFITLIILLIIGIILIFIRHRVVQSPSSSPRPETTAATLTIKNFHHEATENGEKKWTLDASSASLFATLNMAELTDISIIFSAKKGDALSIRAHKGVLNIKTNDMTVSGNIIAEIPPYSLATESLNYQHGSRMIHIDETVEVIGHSMTLKAGSLTYNMATGVLTCENHVEGSFIEIFE